MGDVRMRIVLHPGIGLRADAGAAIFLLRRVGEAEPGTRGGSEYSPGGRLTATAVTVRTLSRLAYRIQDYQLISAPAWLSTERFDVSAKAEDNPPQQALLPEPAPAAIAAPPVPAQSDPPGLSIFAALQEQLGLKLVSDKGAVDTLVIERVEEPSGN